jgi:hypothetical protein
MCGHWADEIDKLRAELAAARATADEMRDKMYAADARAVHAKQQRDSIYRVAKVTKENADKLRLIIRRCVNELEGWRCALAFRQGQTDASEERVNKLIEDCMDAAPYKVTPRDVFKGQPEEFQAMQDTCSECQEACSSECTCWCHGRAATEKGGR